MNSQREVIYKRRRNALYGERIEVDIRNMMDDCASNFIDRFYGNNDYAGLSFEIIRKLSIEPGFTEEGYLALSANELTDKLLDEILKSYNARMESVILQAYPILKNVYETKGSRYENILVPISDGKKIFQISVNLKKAYETKGAELAKVIAKTVTLVVIDEYWKEHLREMDDLKQSVQNAAYEQKDPLLIYKLESYNLFKLMLEKVCRNVTSFLLRAFIYTQENKDNANILKEEQPKRTNMDNLKTSRENLLTNSGQEKQNTPVHVEKKTGRNELCPCGSGKKYKNCHGKLA